MTFVLPFFAAYAEFFTSNNLGSLLMTNEELDERGTKARMCLKCSFHGSCPDGGRETLVLIAEAPIL